MRRSKQTVLLARRAPTIKRWSLDARSEEQSAYSLWGSWGIRRPSLDTRNRESTRRPFKMNWGNGKTRAVTAALANRQKRGRENWKGLAERTCQAFCKGCDCEARVAEIAGIVSEEGRSGYRRKKDSGHYAATLVRSLFTSTWAKMTSGSR